MHNEKKQKQNPKELATISHFDFIVTFPSTTISIQTVAFIWRINILLNYMHVHVPGKMEIHESHEFTKKKHIILKLSARIRHKMISWKEDGEFGGQ